ncbi:hypothetical protein KS4_16060 [Poriferisphaera corsica]|uniref:Uncharacterized protein n=1 Tax=Poriferisphaera corsica TaxID=2528020 RepID=A0A517YTK0_9BACT|nr:hypothetical protein [Poriferisphaera corsica]QDU33555.1 hypothetical protein KS4_16060 [Poriferisphaera corsica]
MENDKNKHKSELNSKLNTEINSDNKSKPMTLGELTKRQDVNWDELPVEADAGMSDAVDSTINKIQTTIKQKNIKLNNSEINSPENSEIKSEKKGIFGRIFGRDDVAGNDESAGGTTDAGNVPALPHEPWHDHCASCYKRDQDGKIKLNENGKPIKVGRGRPKKAKPGEERAGDCLSVGRVNCRPLVVPGRGDDGSNGGHDIAQGMPAGTELPPGAGDVITDLFSNIAFTVFGPDAAMNTAERASITSAARGMCGGRHVPWLIALFIFAGAWIGRVILENYKKKQELKGKNDLPHDTQANRGRVGERQEPSSEKTDEATGGSWLSNAGFM